MLTSGESDNISAHFGQPHTNNITAFFNVTNVKWRITSHFVGDKLINARNWAAEKGPSRF